MFGAALIPVFAAHLSNIPEIDHGNDGTRDFGRWLLLGHVGSHPEDARRSVDVGYSGGDVKNVTYRNHGTHAEAAEIIFEPAVISYRDLLEFFFQIQEGNDRGTSCRSAIHFTNSEREHVARDTIADVDASGLWPGPATTEVAAAGDFWGAEPEHQNYLQRYPSGHTCHFVRPGWKLPKRKVAWGGDAHNTLGLLVAPWRDDAVAADGADNLVGD